MIISRTPFRVSLFGGGTDYPEWFKENGGATFGFALNYHCSIVINPLLPLYGATKYRVVYSKVENKHNVDTIEHPAVREAIKHLRGGEYQPLEIAYMGDIPAQTGLGAGSSFMVGILLALRKAYGYTVPTPRNLASEAIYVERELIGEAVGYQDQIFAAFGGLLLIEFEKGGNWNATTITPPMKRMWELEQSLVMVYTGIMRSAPPMAAAQINNFPERAAELSLLRNMAYTAHTIMMNSATPVCDIGLMLDDAWRIKKRLHPDISNPHIDLLYQHGLESGALGGKLLGAGAGGFILFFVPPDRRKAFESKMSAPCLSVSIARRGAGIITDESWA